MGRPGLVGRWRQGRIDCLDGAEERLRGEDHARPAPDEYHLAYSGAKAEPGITGTAHVGNRYSNSVPPLFQMPLWLVPLMVPPMLLVIVPMLLSPLL